MRAAIFVFDGLAPLDAVGPFEVMRSVPGWEVGFVGLEKGQVRTEAGPTGSSSIGFAVDATLEEAGEPDLILVPGGAGNRPLMEDEAFLAWLRRAAERAKWVTSVCTGSLVLGAAGLLEGKRATSHWLYLERLRELGAEPVAERVVEDGGTVTAAGVSAGIDMALHLVGREAGPEVAQAVQLGIEYDPRPPFDAGSPAKAPEPIRELVASIAAPGEEWSKT